MIWQQGGDSEGAGAARLAELERLQRTAYERSESAHVALLERLWAAACGPAPFPGPVAAGWRRLGFQGSDPGTDVRGAGLLGLEQLARAAEAQPALFRSLLTHERACPLAAASLNITYALWFELFALPNVRPALPQGGALLPRVPREALAEALGQREDLLHALHAALLLHLLERLWADARASYMDFAAVFAQLRRALASLLLDARGPPAQPLPWREVLLALPERVQGWVLARDAAAGALACRLSRVVPAGDLARMVAAQTHVRGVLGGASGALEAWLARSTTALAPIARDVARAARTLAALRTDLHTIFRRLRALRARLPDPPALTQE